MLLLLGLVHIRFSGCVPSPTGHEPALAEELVNVRMEIVGIWSEQGAVFPFGVLRP